jgi:hypothetical protein
MAFLVWVSFCFPVNLIPNLFSFSQTFLACSETVGAGWMAGLYCFLPYQKVAITLAFIVCYGIFITFLTFCLRMNGFVKGFLCFVTLTFIRIIVSLSASFLLCLIKPPLQLIGFVVKAPSCCFRLLVQNH